MELFQHPSDIAPHQVLHEAIVRTGLAEKVGFLDIWLADEVIPNFQG